MPQQDIQAKCNDKTSIIESVSIMYQSIPAVNIPPGRSLGNFFEGAKSLPPGKKAAKPLSPGQKFTCEKALTPHPRGRTRLKELIKDIRSKCTGMY